MRGDLEMVIINFLIIIIGFALIYFLLCIIFFHDEIKAAKERDPAAKSSLEIVFLYSGLHAIIFYRIANLLFRFKVPLIPRFISQFAKFITGIEIHPGAKIGRGLFIDHGLGVVVGETSIIGNNVTLFQGVTLGGTGKERGKRHPTIGNNVVIGAGAKVLGNIIIGDNSYIGANAVVIKSIPPNATVVGVPGRITKQDGKKIDISLDHRHIIDPIWQSIENLQREIESLKKNKP
jgi:serine O-acetyltransferase